MSKFIFKNESGPQIVSLDITGNCNLKCLHCYNSSGDTAGKSDMDFATLKSVVNQIIKFEPLTVCICGGEPTLRKKELLYTISAFKNSGVIPAINMVSNGFIITRDYASDLVTSGLDMIQISLDGHDDFTHDNFRQVKGSFMKAINAISECVKAGLTVSVSTIPNKLNYKNIDKIVDTCYDLGVSSHRAMPFIPMGRGAFSDKWILTPSEYAGFVGRYFYLKSIYEKKGMQVLWGDPLDHLKRMPNNALCGVNTYQMCIKSNGDLVTSPYLNFVVGSVYKKTLQDLWDSVYKKIWENPTWLEYISDIDSVCDLPKLKEFYLA